MLNKQKKTRMGILMLSLLAFSAMHVNIALAAQSFGDVQTAIDYHSQPHESPQSDHITCSNDVQEMLNNRTNTDHRDNFADCTIAQIFTSVAVSPRIFFQSYLIQELSRKPITLTHNIILLI
jgi:hypothetical protein